MRSLTYFRKQFLPPWSQAWAANNPIEPHAARSTFFTLAACLGWICCFLAQTPLSAQDTPGESFFVDPVNGSDTSGDGSAQSPFKSLTRVLTVLDREKSCTVLLAPGVYSEATGESLPIPLPVDARDLRLLGPDGASAEFMARDSESFVFQGEPELQAAGAGSLEIHDVAVIGGEVGLSVVSGLGQDLRVSILGCRFSGQKYQGAELVAGEAAHLDVTVEGCDFRGTPIFALDLGTQSRGELVFNVRQNTFSGDPPESFSFPIRNGLSVVLAGGAEIEGTAERNSLNNVGNGILVTTAESGSLPGTLNLALIGNAVIGQPSPQQNGLKHAVYLSHQGGHSVDLSLVHNTLAGGNGHGIYIEGFPDLGQEAICSGFTLTLEGNLFWGLEAGDMNLEEQDLLPDCFVLHNNAFTDSRLAEEDSNMEILSSDILPQGGYRLTPNSRLVDQGVSSGAGELDVDGNCRLVDGNRDGVFLADVGAFEVSGICVEALDLFLRGDCDRNKLLEVTDAIRVFTYLFLGGLEIYCMDACDSNDDGDLDLTDGVFVLSFMFLGTASPPLPFPDEGLDRTPDQLPLCHGE